MIHYHTFNAQKGSKGKGLFRDVKKIRELRQPGRGYPVLVFHPGLSENAKEQVAIAGYSGRKYSSGGHLSFFTLLEASENRIWLIKLPAKGVNFFYYPIQKIPLLQVDLAGLDMSGSFTSPAAMRWFRFTQMFNHPSLKGWDAFIIEFKMEDSM